MDFKLKKSNLNFKVYTVPTKPTTAGAENDIAIISSVPMPNWMLSPDTPSGIPRSDGDVWIQYSVTGNTFNALKQNAMMIATISAWQYVDGAWVDREAVSCQNGEWVELFTPYLFKDGKIYNGKLVFVSTATVEIRNNELYFSATGAERCGIDADLMTFPVHNSVKFYISAVTNAVPIGFVSELTDVRGATSFIYYKAISTTGWHTMDIPSGVDHVYFCMSDNGDVSCTITEIEVI